MKRLEEEFKKPIQLEESKDEQNYTLLLNQEIKQPYNFNNNVTLVKESTECSSF